MDKLLKFYINGEWVDPVATDRMPVLNPASVEQVGEVALGGEADVDLAVAAAAAAFEQFSLSSKAERLDLLARIRAVTERRFEELAQAMRLEMGAPISMSRDAQADAAIGHLDGFVAALEKLQEQERFENGEVLLREPIGVCGLITPWNWPADTYRLPEQNLAVFKPLLLLQLFQCRNKAIEVPDRGVGLRISGH